METEYDYLFKIVLIGDAGVGKTSIVRRYTDGIFTSAGIPTIGVDFCIKTLQIGSSAVKVSLLSVTLCCFSNDSIMHFVCFKSLLALHNTRLASRILQPHQSEIRFR